MDYIIITNTDNETGGGCVIDVESFEKDNDGGFVYKGLRHGTDNEVQHKQYTPAKIYKTAGSALTAAKTWKEQ